VVQPPTLLNLGFEWEIGDANRNATVAVWYRATGAEVWQDALPLLRMGGERIFRAAEHLDYTWGDWNVLRERKACPGDILMIHAGLYKADRLNYVDPLMTPSTAPVCSRSKAPPSRYAMSRNRDLLPLRHTIEES
jgi:hypothetical protein